MVAIDRRSLLFGATALAAAPARAATPELRLRLLETSDLHMFVYDFDYYHSRTDPTVGLAKVASLIAAARAEHRNALLFDNGDIIQGNPLGDFVARPGGLAAGQPHPMFAAMNELGYLAATLGNHEFNYGLPFLERALQSAKFPFVCANLEHMDGTPYVRPTMVITRDVMLEDGSTLHDFRIGVIGFVPPQIMSWDKSKLEGRVRTTDIITAAQRYVPELRATCDLLVALSHSGIDTGPRNTGLENASFHLASVPGIDVIFTGHSHRVFPGPDYANRPGVDAVRGTLNGIPAVMPGYWGSHLGLIDLDLARVDGAWKITDFKVEARPIYRREGAKLIALADDDPAILRAAAPAHQATIDWVHQPVGRIAYPVNSYFAYLGSENSIGLVNLAQTAYARAALATTDHAALPLLSAAAPFKAGGTGPDAFVDIAPGPITLADLADLYMYANTLVVVKLSGAEVRELLERSAALFNQIDPAKAEPQELLSRTMLGYNFDVISGLTWQIDITRPARYSGGGKLINAEAHRVLDLRFQGQPIDDAASFLVATNNYRADGGGGFPGLDGTRSILNAPDLNRDVIALYVKSTELQTPPPTTWRFAPIGQPVQLRFRSSPALADKLAGRPDITPGAGGSDGYAEYLLTLG